MKPRPLVRRVTGAVLFCLAALGMALLAVESPWSGLDDRVSDLLYTMAVDRNAGPEPAFTPGVVYLTITDASYDAFGKNTLDRDDLARVNQALEPLEPSAVVYDIIFARSGPPEADAAFSRSLEALGCAYLPFALHLSATEPGQDLVQDIVRGPLSRSPRGYLEDIRESGRGRPFHGEGILPQLETFARAAAGSGNISLLPDRDGIFRRLPLLVRTGKDLVPTLGFSVFLDWAGIGPEQIRIDWGEAVTIEAGGDNLLAQDLVIPIDRRGQVRVPFVDRTGQDFPGMEAHTLVRLAQDPNFTGNLLDLFEGSMVLVADTATGTSDLGDTPIESSAPLVNLHAALINGLLTGTFYRPWSGHHVSVLLALCILVLGAAAALRSPWFLYLTGPGLLAGLTALGWRLFLDFSLFPLATAALTVLATFTVLVATLETATARDRALIKKTFSRYVPGPVVKALLKNPDLLVLGGEEREATVLFSDIAGFTALSEQLPPADLVALLNRYFTEMTGIIQAQGGIIDKYIGDAIMAEFGVPLETGDHADKAVAAALAMQQRLAGLRREWEDRGLPRVTCRMGINTDTMVVGNIGSDRVFDYTVLGDAVNLASRLEGANKVYGTALMISGNTRDRLTPGRFVTRQLDLIVVKGQTKAVAVYEVLGTAGDASGRMEFVRTYESAFQDYLDQNLIAAKNGFSRALDLEPEDHAARLMLKRTAALARQTGKLPDNWTGAVRLTEK